MRRFRAVERSRTRSRAYWIAVVALHVVGVGLLALDGTRHPGLWALGVLAYTLGLRHAFDPDHIAAIDNSVRRFLQTKTPAHGTGFWFSLGHSSVVVLLALGLAFAGAWVARSWPQWREWGSVVGPSVSGAFLLAIGLVNFVLWWDVWTLFRQLRRGAISAPASIAGPQGVLVKFLQPLFRLVTKSWHLFPLGFLFGLGFDTASEVAFLALSAQGSAQSLPSTALLALPILFASGMSLLDTADGLFMTTAYGWSSVSPLKKVYYNLSVTGLSVLVAVVIGAVELLQALGVGWVTGVDFANLGFFLAGAFVLAWVASWGTWKILRLEKGRN